MEARVEMAVAPEDVQVAAKPQRRSFTAEYKRRILKEADACTTPGAVGTLLRRERLYSSHLVEWRRARARGERAVMIARVEERQARVGIAPLCDALGLARATFDRRRGAPPPGPTAPRERRAPRQGRTPTERAGVLAVLHEERFVDLPPAQVWALRLDAGHVPPCSIRTMYRDYVLLDIFSRYVVGWLLARQESAALAKVLIAESCERQHIGPDQLIIQCGPRPSMTSQPVALLLATLGAVPSHSRPQVFDDDPSPRPVQDVEAQFETLKYRPDFPARFGAYEDAETFCRRFFPWYNLEHRHGALGLMRPHDIHYGLAAAKWQQRADVLRAAYHAHPGRFPRGVPVPPPLPTAAWINKPPAAPALAAPEGILRIQAQRDRLQDQAAHLRLGRS